MALISHNPNKVRSSYNSRRNRPRDRLFISKVKEVVVPEELELEPEPGYDDDWDDVPFNPKYDEAEDD